MNVTSFEFTACQAENMSPIVLSEFAGAAGCLGGSLLVNPHYEKKVAKGLYQALNMSDDYKKLRHKANFDYVVKHNALYWISQFLKLLMQTDSSRFNFAPSLSVDELHESYVDVIRNCEIKTNPIVEFKENDIFRLRRNTDSKKTITSRSDSCTRSYRTTQNSR